MWPLQEHVTTKFVTTLNWIVMIEDIYLNFLSITYHFLWLFRVNICIHNDLFLIRFGSDSWCRSKDLIGCKVFLGSQWGKYKLLQIEEWRFNSKWNEKR